MPIISKRELMDYQQLCRERANGRLLSSDTLLMMCKALDYNPEAIGRELLESLARMRKDMPPSPLVREIIEAESPPLPSSQPF